MSKLTEIKISNFSGGISDSPRENNASKYQVAKHFDVFTDPTRLIPYRSLEADQTASVADDMKQYVIKDYMYASGSDKLYGLGQTGAGNAKIVYKANATTGVWTLPASSEGNGAVKNGCFVEYKDYLWGFQGTNQIFKYGLLSGTPSITNSASTTGVSITSVAQGLVFEDYLYLPYNNKIWRATDATTFSDAYLVLPTNTKITSLTAYGKYIAIAVAPISNYNGVSKVLLWDGTSTDIQESIDWGEGELRILETIEGILVGVSDRYLNNATGAGKGSMIVQIYQGGAPQVVKEVFTKALTGKTIPLNKAVKNNRVFWAAKIMDNAEGTLYTEGIWSFGRKNVNFPFSLSLDVIDENINTSGIQAFGMAGNFFFITHSGDGSIDKTNDANTFAFTSIYESQILDFGDSFSDKTLLKLNVAFRKLATGESVTAKYKWDDATAYTTAGTFSTAGELSHSFLNIESTGLSFGSGKELTIRVESAGGAEILGISATARVNDTP